LDAEGGRKPEGHGRPESIPAASTKKPEKVTRKGGLFWFLAATGNEAAKRVQPNHEVVRQRGSAATAAPFYLRGGEDEGRIIPAASAAKKAIASAYL